MNNADEVASRAAACGGSIVFNVEDRKYAASMIPDEDDMKSFPVRYGRICDPDGYIVEVKEAMSGSVNPILEKATLKVLDLNDSIAFYEKLGLKLLRKRSNGMPINAYYFSFLITFLLLFRKLQS